ncbi:signal transduction histidine kinase internal region [Lucifera butyrica]|uniref:histidine kinase n=1 Tax=Lucifera butyrica TaxID=1351585 RepID=A0A498R3B9_9FIRM|nr:PocR ligand-binding domain-containing protein [Lucifera butyrica]VBB05290.1 signal transduction histidine kinase internal region [Lucifera butyrica]
MQKYQGFALGEIVNVSILQEIQDKFSEVTGLASVIVDVNGKPVTSPSRFTGFCNYVRSCPSGFQRCMACDDRGGRQATADKRPFVYHCHAGLTDLAAPIIVHNEYMGAFLAGQVVLPEDNYNAKEEMRRRVADLGLEAFLLEEHFNAVETVPANKVKAAADLIYLMANYIVEMGIANIVQKQLMSEMKAKADLENMLRATELKALQSQVNPHFLFNTLNTIARLALLEGAGRTQEVVYALSDLLRNNLRDIDQLETLASEVSSIKHYLVIQQVRFGDRIQACIDIAPDLMGIRIPAMTLQPLVENAIIHGLEPKKEGGRILINASRQGLKVRLTVADTGVGITPERVREIFRAEKRTATRGQTTGLGIINVHKRIQHYFGGDYGVSIEGTPGAETRVHIFLPFAQ